MSCRISTKRQEARGIERQDDAGQIQREEAGGRKPQDGRRGGPEEKTQNESTLHGGLLGDSQRDR
jgi:hypothetical protein